MNGIRNPYQLINLERNGMKKGIFPLLLVVVVVFVQGCQSATTTERMVGSRPDSSAKVGYPEGHDNHPATTKEHVDEYHPLMDYS